MTHPLGGPTPGPQGEIKEKVQKQKSKFTLFAAKGPQRGAASFSMSLPYRSATQFRAHGSKTGCGNLLKIYGIISLHFYRIGPQLSSAPMARKLDVETC
jgi:hypothetical protein